MTNYIASVITKQEEEVFEKAGEVTGFEVINAQGGSFAQTSIKKQVDKGIMIESSMKRLNI